MKNLSVTAEWKAQCKAWCVYMYDKDEDERKYCQDETMENNEKQQRKGTS